MATYANAILKLATLIADNSNKNISAADLREVVMELIQSISESVAEGQIPVMVGGKHVGYGTLKYIPGTGELQLDEFRLGRGVQNVNEIYNSGPFTGNAAKTIPTKFYIDRRRVVVGVITDPIDIGTVLRAGQTVTLDGDIEHVIAEGETFLLQGQEDAAENIPYTAVADSEEETPLVADWYDAAKNQEISVELGPATKKSMPAVEEGADPVALPDKGKLAWTFFVINNF